MGDVTGTEAATARRLVHDCPECAALYADIAVISASVRSDLPIPVRTRDFRLSPQDAQRLRRRPGFGDWLRGLLVPGGSVLQPLAGAALSIGIALVVAGTILPAPTVSTFESAGSGQAASAPGTVAPTAAPASPRDTRAADASDTAAQPPVVAPVAGAVASPGVGAYGSTDASPAASAAPAAAQTAAPTAAPTAAASAALSLPAGGGESGNTFGSASASARPFPAPTMAPGTTASRESSGPGVTKATTPAPATQRLVAPTAASSATPTGDTAAIVAGGTGTASGAPLAPTATPVPPQEDRRPLLIVLGLLLGLGGAVLLGVRSLARRA